MVLHLKRNTALKYMGEERKKRYIIEIRYVDAAGRKGKPNEWVYEELDIRTDDIYWSMEQYQRNRQPFDWEIKFEYSNL